MDLRLDGKAVLVTGASRGIGLAIATRCADAGASVMLVARTEGPLAAAAAGIGSAAAFLVANAGDADAPAHAVKATIERFGSCDVLVNNAATNPYFGPMVAIDRSRADKIVQVNQSAVLAWTQAAWQGWMAANGGVVCNIASVGALLSEPGIGWYNVTKAAVIALTRQLAAELGPTVRVNAIAPGLVRTDFARVLVEAAGDAVAERLPLRRLGEPDDIGRAALFLVSDAASWITGHTLVVDGGAVVTPNGGI
jgi:NAD(P)-dependent dehydrogenase (short-subunit alcohol dehydrogenase family)